ncbi:pinin/SDK/memA/ protein conserved region-domain-containing protein [Exophiala viscosa]|uniref:Pinin/SDK/memA/ protein conserved region-domain-containing protein n=1 Tax=Exophiala viscosa TaxID=2486360 RepID=A0AAN6IC14_9EURO|nr:pinin/SDK/memA/ protein conserved region-domain-containing protein [Exophiala viscosa]
MISSAVVIPDEPQLLNGSSDQPTSLKRRQSSASLSPETNKRPRLDAHGADNVANSPPPSSRTAGSPTTRNGAEATSSPRQPEAGRRKSSQTVEQDKSRNRRLFGALLGTLSQPSRPSKSATGSTVPARNSRREEIENRQRDRLKQENEEVAELARSKKEELDRVRRSEQLRWDEQGMRIRHGNQRANARFLRTNVEPRLYYKPWELREKEEDTIKRQIEEAEDTIRRELDEFEAKRARGQPEASGESRSPQTRRDQDTEMNDDQSLRTDHAQEGQDDSGLDSQTVSKRDEQQPTDGADQPEPSQEVRMTEPKQEAEDTTLRPVSKDDDHGGEELELGQEDDVIY